MENELEIIKEDSEEKQNAKKEKNTEKEYEKYSTDDVAEKIEELINLKEYFIFIFLKPMAILFLLVLSSFIFFIVKDKNMILSIIYLILGIILSITNGFISGLFKAPVKFKEDMSNVILYSFKIVKEIKKDSKNSGHSNLKTNSKIFSGVMLQVIIPAINQVVIKNLSILGFFIGLIISWVLNKFIKMTENKKNNINIDEIIEENEKDGENKEENKNKLSSTFNTIFKIALFPLRILQFIVLSFSFILMIIFAMIIY